MGFPVNEALLKEIIRKIVAEDISQRTSGVDRQVDIDSGVIAVNGKRVELEPFATGKAGDQVYLKDIFSLAESPRLGCGIMEMKASCFDWTLRYDEIDYVIEGRLEIIVAGKKMVGEAGDILLIPRNTAIQFNVPTFARFLYVTYPANWQQKSPA
jgi:ethanolamine utilization protein EutQ